MCDYTLGARFPSTCVRSCKLIGDDEKRSVTRVGRGNIWPGESHPIRQWGGCFPRDEFRAPPTPWSKRWSGGGIAPANSVQTDTRHSDQPQLSPAVSPGTVKTWRCHSAGLAAKKCGWRLIPHVRCHEAGEENGELDAS